MPNCNTHKLVGVMSGGLFAAYRAKDQSPDNRAAECVGGVIGGYFGGPFPDILEPAISPWHRGVAHSYSTGASVIAGAADILAGWEKVCRNNAENAKALRMTQTPSGMSVPASPNPIQQALLSLEELFWRLAAGFLNGFVAGYVSHLALDALTPRSIPLLGGRSSRICGE